MAAAADPRFETSERVAAPQSFAVAVHAHLGALRSVWPRSGAPTDARCHIFQTAEFIDVWTGTYGAAARARTFFVEVRDGDGALALLIPLAIVTHGGTRILRFIDEESADYNAPILFPLPWSWTPESAMRLWDALKAAMPLFDVAILDKMPAEVGGLVNPLHFLADEPNPVSCHLNDLRRPWAEIEKTQPAMRTLKKKIRALDRLAPTRMLIAQDKAERDAILAKLLAQKQRRFEDTQVPGFDAHPEKRAFFTRATETFAETGSLHLAALIVGDKIIATLWGLLHGKHYYALVIGYEAGQWSRYSPGRVLHHHVLRWLFDHGFEIMDLGIGDEPWKLEQCETTIPQVRKTEPVTWRGRLYVKRMATLQRLRQSALWERIRPLKWIVLRRFRDVRRGHKPRQQALD